jgi:hypothetical protein
MSGLSNNDSNNITIEFNNDMTNTLTEQPTYLENMPNIPSEFGSIWSMTELESGPILTDYSDDFNITYVCGSHDIAGVIPLTRKITTPDTNILETYDINMWTPLAYDEDDFFNIILDSPKRQKC